MGTAPNAALIAVAPKIATSFVNAAAAVVISVPLFFALDKALRRTGFYTLIHAQKAEKGSYWNPVTGMLAAYCCLITLVFAIYLGSVNNIRKAEAEKEAAVASQLADYEAKLQYLADELNVTLPETEPEG